MLAELIKKHAAESAAKGDWNEVAETLNALRNTITVGRVGGKASLSALVAAGIDPGAVITAMRSDPMASELLNTLTASGVDWADELTAFVMGKLVRSGKITQQTADVMRSLSVRVAPVVVTTADACRDAWQADLAETAAQQASAIRAARIASLQKIDAVTIVDSALSLEDAIASIRANLISFGAWS